MENRKIAYLGPKASFTYEASIKYFESDNLFIPVNRISEIFDEVMIKFVDFGVVPAENSVGGSIVDTLDLFINNKLKVYDQITLQISQNLFFISDRSKI